MARAILEVEGGPALRRALKAAEADLGDLRKVNLEVARIVAITAARSAPRRTGKLAFSVKPGATRTRAYVKVGGQILGGIVSADGKWRGEVPYANVIHWGWPRDAKKLRNVSVKFRTWTPSADPKWFIRPQPFITQAARDTEPYWTNLYQREIDRITAKIGPATNRGN